MQSDKTLIENYILKHPEDVIRVVEKQSDKDISMFISSLPTAIGARLISHMDLLKAARLLKRIDFQFASDLLDKVPTGTTTSLLRLLDQSHRDQLLAQFSPKKQTQLLISLRFPRDAVGAGMDPTVFTLDPHLTVAEAVQNINSSDQDLGRRILVKDQYRKLKGYIRFQELLRANPKQKVVSLLRTDMPSILADTRVSENLLNDLNLDLWWDQTPVVDTQGILLGVISKAKFSQDLPQDKSSDRQARKASVALAELYQIGLTGLFSATNE